jgi:hypothetical protein
MAVSLSALRPGRPLPAGRFLVVIFIRGWIDPGAVVPLEGFGKLKKSNNLIWNGTRDFPACSIVPQPITLPRDLGSCYVGLKIDFLSGTLNISFRITDVLPYIKISLNLFLYPEIYSRFLESTR